MSVNVYNPEVHRKLWVEEWVSNVRGLEARDAHLALQVYSGSVDLFKIAGQHSLNYPPSFLFRYLERLVRSLLCQEEYEKL